jgi:hypothetical protein
MLEVIAMYDTQRQIMENEINFLRFEQIVYSNRRLERKQVAYTIFC